MSSSPKFKIALLSDLHFGSVPEGLAALLLDDVNNQMPGLVVVAGDLTLRARRREFLAAGEFLAALRSSVMVLAGNHDLPYFNLWERFTNPYRRFALAAVPEVNPVFDDGRHLVAGLNTTRSWQPHLKWQEGVARRRDVLRAIKAFRSRPEAVFKAIVTHHPLAAVEDIARVRPVLGATRALKVLTAGGAEVLMAGHVHQSYCIPVKAGNRTSMALGAPTALSDRLRGEANGYWTIEVSDTSLDIRLRMRNDTAFIETRALQHSREHATARYRGATHGSSTG